MSSCMFLHADLLEPHYPEKVETLKGSVMEALQYTSASGVPSNSSRPLQIVMLLPHIRQVALQLTQHFISVHGDHQLHSDVFKRSKFELLKEMMDAFIKVSRAPAYSPSKAAANASELLLSNGVKHLQ